MSRYHAAHLDLQGAGDARPTALQVIHDEGLEGKLKGKVIVITGGTSGIGLETARALATTGATLYLPVRDGEKAQNVLDQILEPNRVKIVEMDVASLASVRNAATSILSSTNNRINILINNAGVMGLKERQLTGEGHEMIFATNYLGHFLLFQLLKPALLASACPDFHSRVVNVSSSSHRAHRLRKSDDYEFQQGEYSYAQAYCNSKLAQVYMSNEIDRRFGSQGLHATSLHPGAINTDLARNIGQEFVEQLLSNEYIVKILKSPEQGAATTVMATIGKDWEDKGGRYLEDCKEAPRGADDGQEFGTGYVSHTYDAEEESRLWTDTLELLDMSDTQ